MHPSEKWWMQVVLEGNFYMINCAGMIDILLDFFFFCFAKREMVSRIGSKGRGKDRGGYNCQWSSVSDAPLSESWSNSQDEQGGSHWQIVPPQHQNSSLLCPLSSPLARVLFPLIQFSCYVCKYGCLVCACVKKRAVLDFEARLVGSCRWHLNCSWISSMESGLVY